jgi:hypothetical protein
MMWRLTRMKSLPRPWYFANSRVAAALTLEGCRRPDCRMLGVCCCLALWERRDWRTLCMLPLVKQSPAQRCCSMLNATLRGGT